MLGLGIVKVHVLRKLDRIFYGLPKKEGKLCTKHNPDRKRAELQTKDLLVSNMQHDRGAYCVSSECDFFCYFVKPPVHNGL